MGIASGCRGAMASTIFSISRRFVILEAVSLTKYRCSLSQNVGLATPLHIEAQVATIMSSISKQHFNAGWHKIC